MKIADEDIPLDQIAVVDLEYPDDNSKVVCLLLADNSLRYFPGKDAERVRKSKRIISTLSRKMIRVGDRFINPKHVVKPDPPIFDPLKKIKIVLVHLDSGAVICLSDGDGMKFAKLFKEWVDSQEKSEDS